MVSNVPFPGSVTGSGERWMGGLPPAVLVLVLIAAQLHNPILFHVLAEFAAVSLAVLLSVVGLQAYPLARNRFLLFLACGYFWVAGLDLLHALAYQGMGVLPGDGSNRSIQLWIMARTLEALVLLGAPWFLRRSLGRGVTFWGIGAVASLLAALVATGWLPAAYVADRGLTPEAQAGEYVAILLLVGAAVQLWRYRGELDSGLVKLVGISIALTAAAEFLFAFDTARGQWPMTGGHLLKIFSLWLIYLGMVRITLSEPFRALVRDASTFDAVPDPTVVVDGQGIIRQTNRAARLFLQGDEAQCVGRHCHELLHPRDTDRADCPICRAVAGGTGLDAMEVQRDGRWLRVTLSPLNTQGRVVGSVHVSHDITERKAAEWALKASEARFRGLVENTRDWVWEVDTEARYTYASPRVWDMLGYAPEEVVGKVPFDFMPDGERERVREAFGAVATRRQAFNGLENINRHRDGRLVVLESSGVPFFDEEGRYLGFRGIDRDVTERKEAENSLRESRAQLAKGEEIAGLGSWYVDTVTGKRHWSAGLYRVLGLDPQSVAPSFEEFYRHLMPDARERVESAIQSTLAGQCADLEHAIIRPDGEERFLHIQTKPVFDASGEVISFTGSALDITERKRVERALAKQHAELEAVFANTHVLIAVMDRDFDFVRVNSAYARAAGRTPEDLVGCNIFTLFPGVADEKLFHDVVASGEPCSVSSSPYRVPGSSENTYWDWTLSPLKDGHDRTEGVLLTMVDATERERQRRQAEQAWRSARSELERRVTERTREWATANRKLEVANRELESFSYSVSHDLRGPLRAINGFTHALEEDYEAVLDSSGRDYIARVRGATVRMGELIDGLLNLSRVFRADLKIARVDLSALATDYADQLRSAEPGRDVAFNIEPGLLVMGDATLLRVLLQNLIGNAWKFTGKQASATITVGCTTMEGERVYYVRDDGVGFEMEYVHKLFEPFERLHRQDEFEGTGIGLATARRIVQRHGGEVWGEAAPGDGATLYFTLSARPDATAPSPAATLPETLP